MSVCRAGVQTAAAAAVVASKQVQLQTSSLGARTVGTNPVDLAHTSAGSFLSSPNSSHPRLPAPPPSSLSLTASLPASTGSLSFHQGAPSSRGPSTGTTGTINAFQGASLSSSASTLLSGGLGNVLCRGEDTRAVLAQNALLNAIAVTKTAALGGGGNQTQRFIKRQRDQQAVVRQQLAHAFELEQRAKERREQAEASRGRKSDWDSSASSSSSSSTEKRERSSRESTSHSDSRSRDKKKKKS